MMTTPKGSQAKQHPQWRWIVSLRRYPEAGRPTIMHLTAPHPIPIPPACPTPPHPTPPAPTPHRTRGLRRDAVARQQAVPQRARHGQLEPPQPPLLHREVPVLCGDGYRGAALPRQPLALARVPPKVPHRHCAWGRRGEGLGGEGRDPTTAAAASSGRHAVRHPGHIPPHTVSDPPKPPTPPSPQGVAVGLKVVRVVEYPCDV